MEHIDYTVISQNLRILFGMGVSFFNWSFWTIAQTPYKKMPIIRVNFDGSTKEYESMKECRLDNALSVKEFRSRLKNPYKTLESSGHAFYFVRQWKAQGGKHIIPVQLSLF